MSKSNSHAGWLVSALLIVVLLPAAYIGSYYALAQRSYSFFGGPFVTYRVEGVSTFYHPAHWLDCQLRPDYWGGY